MSNEPEDILCIVRAAIAAADPELAVRARVSRLGDLLRVDDREFDLTKFKRVALLGMGKAAAPMVRAMAEILGPAMTDGLAVVKTGHAARVPGVEMIEASHPVPGKEGRAATRKILDLAEGLGKDDLALCLISGGTSALTPQPAPPVTLAEKQAMTDLLLACGADIREMNALRKHLSVFKGGGLARALAPARVVSLIVSDVVGDDPSTIASGPTAPDPTSYADCLGILDKYNLRDRTPAAVLKRLETGAAGRLHETVKSGDPCLEKVWNLIIADNRMALDAAARKAGKLGYAPLVLTSRLRGEAREAARALAGVAEEAVVSASPVAPPACILAGGETTVTLRGDGKGGRNQEFVLAAILSLDPNPDTSPRIYVASVGSDGNDGPTDAAGAWAGPRTLAKARRLGLDPQASLARNDSYPLLAETGSLIITGPTLTNVMDVVLFLVTGEKK